MLNGYVFKSTSRFTSHKMISPLSAVINLFLAPFFRITPNKTSERYSYELHAIFAVDISGWGVALRSCDSSGLPEISGGAQDNAKANAAKLHRLSYHHELRTQFVADFPTKMGGKDILIKNTSVTMNAIQAEMGSTENRCWATVQVKFTTNE